MTTPDNEDQDQDTGPAAALRESLADNDFTRGADSAGRAALAAARHLETAANALVHIRVNGR